MADDRNPALAHALALVADRWTLGVLAALRDGPRRYSDLADALDGIAPNVLAARLRRLEADGLVLATPYSRRPVRMAYALTASGTELGAALDALAAWGARRLGVPGERVHASCGTATELRAWCPTCERVVADGDTEAHALVHL